MTTFYTDTERECKNIILFVFGITRSNHLPDTSCTGQVAMFANLIRTSILLKYFSNELAEIQEMESGAFSLYHF